VHGHGDTKDKAVVHNAQILNPNPEFSERVTPRSKTLSPKP